jgi:hypothetical protein
MITARARWARIVATYSSSRSGLRRVLAMTTTRPRCSHWRITPSAIAEKYGSEMSCTTSPTTLLAPRAIACACGLAW